MRSSIIGFRSSLSLIAALSCLVGGCAYYNLFYNAEKAFEQAEHLGDNVPVEERPSPQQKAGYRRCITKCKLLLEEYPESNYVDDALFFIGKSYFQLKELREYRTAIKNFDAVLANFPQSPFRGEALYLKALCHLSLGEEQIALDSLRRLRESESKTRFTIEALYQLADRYAERESYDEALAYYERYRDEYPKHEERSEVAYRHARVLSKLGRSDEAIVILESIRTDRMSETTAFEARLLQAEMLADVERRDDASSIVDEIRDAAENLRRGDLLRQLEGEIQLKRGLEEEGVKTLLGIAEEFEKSEPGGRARHTLANYYLDRYGPDDERIEEQLSAVEESRTAGESAVKLRELGRRLADYRMLRDRIALSESPADTLANAIVDSVVTKLGRGGLPQAVEPVLPGDPAALSFEMGELMLSELKRPEDALRYYRKALTLAPDSTGIAPRAAYAIGFILERHLEQPESAARAYADVERRFPQSPQARALRGENFLEVVARARTREISQIGGGPIAAGGNGGGFQGDAANHPLRSLRLGGPGATHSRRP